MWSCGILSFRWISLTKVFSIRVPVYVDTDSITSLKLAKSMKSSDKYLKQGRFMITFI